MQWIIVQRQPILFYGQNKINNIRIMKKFCLIITSLLFLISCLLSCDDISQEPRVKQEYLSFTAKGGKQNVEVVLKRYSWKFCGLLDPERNYVMIDSEKIENEVLENGVQRIHYDWITFLISKDKKNIEVIVDKNYTKKTRLIVFDGFGERVDFNFRVFQAP
ncbi:hypothetical protein HMPREF1860_01686 [Prevotella amnii]|uniref:BACON domain-containing protein n=2 Tax=Prevotella amnii TaxID=419005 RepID=A0A134B7Q1_9BACT|nr:hypothetical protein HMPREF1860_01686 [Prevotella amnii]